MDNVTAEIPEHDDMRDLVEIVAPYETPLLAHLGYADSVDAVKNGQSKIYSDVVGVDKSTLGGTLADLGHEMRYQQHERLRGLLRDLEHDVINGSSDRSIAGLIPSIKTRMSTADNEPLCEYHLNQYIRDIFEESPSQRDTIVVGGYQARAIDGFASRAAKKDRRIYRHRHRICHIIVSRWMPADCVLLLDSAAISIAPVNGHHFRYRTVASTPSQINGTVSGEYAVDIVDQKYHALIRGLRSR